jgi:hypothetical protein
MKSGTEYEADSLEDGQDFTIHDLKNMLWMATKLTELNLDTITQGLEKLK